MTEANHTPGPWWAYCDDDACSYRIKTVPTEQREYWNGHEVATLPMKKLGDSLSADAHLIAAAPDLLAALEATRIVLAEHEPHPLPVLAQVLAAIAKAKGKS
jgi:type VI protein secretion system component VasF